MKKLIALGFLALLICSCQSPAAPRSKIKASNDSIGIKQPKFNVNVYLENSASMDGYVKGVTEFETAIYNLLGDIKISDFCDSLNLNYINSQIRVNKENALSADIEDFIKKLEPTTFKQRGGDRTSSDLKNILSTLLQKVDNDNLTILISDCIFSPGSGQNAQDYLNNQSVGLKIDFASKLKNSEISLLTLQLESMFDGAYYNQYNTPIHIVSKRPYYILFLGTSDQLDGLIASDIVENIRGGYKNKVFYTNKENHYFPGKLSYKLLPNKKIGDFKLDNASPKNSLINAEKASSGENKGKFGFSVAADFSNSFLPSEYFIDTSVLTVSTDYKIAIEAIRGKTSKSLKNYTHILNFETRNLKNESVELSIVARNPRWTSEINTDDDRYFGTDKSLQNKTFGIRHLFAGVSEAFVHDRSSNEIAKVTINVKESGFSFPWLLAILIIIIASGLIVYKNRK